MTSPRALYHLHFAQLVQLLQDPPAPVARDVGRVKYTDAPRARGEELLHVVHRFLRVLHGMRTGSVGEGEGEGEGNGKIRL